MELLDPAGDQLLANRCGVGLCQHVLDAVVRGGGDPLQDLVGGVVARLDALEVEDRQPSEPPQLGRQPHVRDRIHCGGQDRNLERNAAEVLRKDNVGGINGVGAGGQRDILEAVRGSDRIDL